MVRRTQQDEVSDAAGAGERLRRKRRPYRRDDILAAAVTLFHERGYHATGMDEIGAATGITGPAIYRHFRNKEEILETLVLERSTAALDESRAIVDAEPPKGSTTLDQLVAHYVRFLLTNPALAVVAAHERRTLRAEVRAELNRMERLYHEEWVGALRRVRPELDDAEARVMVRAAHGMGVSAVGYKSGLDADALSTLMQRMMLQLLGADRSVQPARNRSRARPRAATA
jgi:AcrR family transcriptional regulator